MAPAGPASTQPSTRAVGRSSATEGLRAPSAPRALSDRRLGVPTLHLALLHWLSQQWLDPSSYNFWSSAWGEGIKDVVVLLILGYIAKRIHDKVHAHLECHVEGSHPGGTLSTAPVSGLVSLTTLTLRWRDTPPSSSARAANAKGRG